MTVKLDQTLEFKNLLEVNASFYESLLEDAKYLENSENEFFQNDDDHIFRKLSIFKKSKLDDFYQTLESTKENHTVIRENSDIVKFFGSVELMRNALDQWAQDNTTDISISYKNNQDKVYQDTIVYFNVEDNDKKSTIIELRNIYKNSFKSCLDVQNTLSDLLNQIGKTDSFAVSSFIASPKEMFRKLAEEEFYQIKIKDSYDNDYISYVKIQEFFGNLNEKEIGLNFYIHPNKPSQQSHFIVDVSLDNHKEK